MSSTETGDITTAISSDEPVTSVTTHDQENNIIVTSTTVLEHSTNSRPLIFATASTVEKQQTVHVRRVG